MDTTTPATAQLLHALHYMYRDAGNWKTSGVVLLAGPLSAADQDRIFGSLDSGLLFVAEQVGIPPLQRKHQEEYGAADADLDHAFHELIALRPASDSEIAEADMRLCSATTAAAFATVAGRWDCTYSPYGRW
jgi:hypothetical protein